MISFFHFVEKVYAAAPAITPIGNPDNVTTDFQGVIYNLGAAGFGFLWLIGSIFAVLFILYGALLYISSAGDVEKVKKARTTIINAAIGVVLLVSTYAIIRLAVTIGHTIDRAVR